MKPTRTKMVFLTLVVVLIASLVMSACGGTETVTTTQTVTQTQATTQTVPSSTQTATTTIGAGQTVTITPAPSTKTVTATVTGPATTITQTAAGTATTSVAAPIYVLKTAENFPPTGITSEAKKWWADQVKQRTGGRVEIKFYWSASLSTWADMVKALQSGITDIGHTPSSYNPSVFPLYTLVDMAGNATDEWAGMKAAMELAFTDPYLKGQLEGLGLKAIQAHDSGAFYYGFKSPVTKIDDMKGKTIRSYGASFINLEKQVGLNPVFMSYADIYEALNRGTIDGSGFTYQLSDSYKHQEVIKYVLEFNAGVVLGTMELFNLKVWNSLPADIQDVFIKLSNDYVNYFGQIMIDAENQIRQKWQAAGVTVTKLTPEDQAKRAEYVKKAQDEYVAQVAAMPGGEKAPDVWANYQTLLKKYHDEVAQKGHPW